MSLALHSAIDRSHPIYQESDPRKVREMIRRGEWTGSTRGLAMGHTQVNLIIVPRSDAYDMMLLCQRNPRPCPLLEVTDAGDPEPRIMAPGADLRTDLPRYRVFRHGELVDEPTDVLSYWRDDLVGFLVGCSMTFEGALLAAGVPLRKVGALVYRTNIPLRPAGRFRCNMGVSMMAMPVDKAIRAVQVTTRFPGVHGAPIHIGDPAAIGIKDIERPDWGTGTANFQPGDTYLFWPCGVTPVLAGLEARLEFMITHAPATVLVTNMRDEALSIM